VPNSSIPATAEGVPNFSHRESDDDYQPVVAVLADRWRVIVCRDGMQWIIQSAEKSSHGVAWRGRRYLRTKNRLIAICGTSLGEIRPSALAILQALPERI
jgi:hypothetical protein